MLCFEAAIFQITDQYKPCSARHVYYQAVTRGLVEKDSGKSRANEQKVGNALNQMRENMIDIQKKRVSLDQAVPPLPPICHVGRWG